MALLTLSRPALPQAPATSRSRVTICRAQASGEPNTARRAVAASVLTGLAGLFLAGEAEATAKSRMTPAAASGSGYTMTGVKKLGASKDVKRSIRENLLKK
ncbi:hypothetical protein WJX73_002328 [Symbiochloris irregularis]|uniref:Uncharacterized protein n=1 Tax=Symbiochloris irregularis TaxID=706552 RepID=A0AAW1PBS4_9CHLO